MQERKSAGHAGPRGSGGCEILVVAGDPISSAGWRAVLDAQDWVGSCHAVSGVADAVVHVRSRVLDVVLVDLVLADGHGIDLCRSLRAIADGLRIVLVSEDADRSIGAA